MHWFSAWASAFVRLRPVERSEHDCANHVFPRQSPHTCPSRRKILPATTSREYNCLRSIAGWLLSAIKSTTRPKCVVILPSYTERVWLPEPPPPEIRTPTCGESSALPRVPLDAAGLSNRRYLYQHRGTQSFGRHGPPSRQSESHTSHRCMRQVVALFRVGAANAPGAERRLARTVPGVATSVPLCHHSVRYLPSTIRLARAESILRYGLGRRLHAALSWRTGFRQRRLQQASNLWPSTDGNDRDDQWCPILGNTIGS
jgi:hypothetical protein